MEINKESQVNPMLGGLASLTEQKTKETEGYIYILESPKTELLKIGGSDYPPSKRIKEINSTEPYKSIGPWSLVDFRQVKDWRKVEYNLHYAYRSKLDETIEQQKELFFISKQEVAKRLNEIDPAEIVNKPKIDRMFQDSDFSNYIINLFQFTGLLNWLNIQGAWTFVLFPSTAGGRYFTINIGPHEVAFSSFGSKDIPQINMILVDRLILDYSDVINWISDHYGTIRMDQYARALPRSTTILFEGSFENVNEFLRLNGVRRALIAYWNEALIKLKEDNSTSMFAKYHNWNAIAEIHKIIDNIE